ncbi:Holliday junction branch migration protein RuvA [Desulfobulbus oligotrophicus]|jgi:Holliday junction DNA helicase RuvA|uniref:Holliday junction branch migration complex subunit RuvA n=1 Tax=Desulfobulbus oligotrophicus TaxID=1909699 RepID=A0A7T5VCK4_9BACT|nr:Holliday junction branch migration protein RuvA [Desulfobulbus oligotrophicus]MDY0390910.1 Holliday junction branch migration protein RuvA [Desulfobulbus oligotrophicus]QQG65342.1 Holliday junction branch migration protein RuvA [Desulfobulbus oligotrophicus]
MIASLNGSLLAKSPGTVVVDVGGVGYEVFISSRTYDMLPENGQVCSLFIQTVVRADAINLFGFSKKEEKELFLLLIAVSGIGPKLALTILSGIGVGEFCQAIMAKDLARLTTFPGIGKKTAQRLCVELAEKVDGLSGSDAGASAVPRMSDTPTINVMGDAVSALINLGYPQATAWQVLRTVEEQLAGEVESPPVEELIRRALRLLAAR